MADTLNTKHLKGFIMDHELCGMQAQVETAHRTLHEKTGLGNDFLGWLTLPTDYDKEEFARIKAAAEKIKKDSDILIVIGIGGSYLGAGSLEFSQIPTLQQLKEGYAGHLFCWQQHQSFLS